MAAIEPTSAMRLAFAEAPGADKDCVCAICLNHRLAAVLAIVERERCMEPRGHVYHPLAKPGPAATVVHQLVAGDDHVHCCGRLVADVDAEHEHTTLNPYAVTCRGPS